MGKFILEIKADREAHNCRAELPNVVDNLLGGSVWLCDCGRAWRYQGYEQNNPLGTKGLLWQRHTDFDRRD